MAVGLGSLQKKADAKADKAGKKNPSANEAADILKKMDAKADAGDCPFC